MAKKKSRTRNNDSKVWQKEVGQRLKGIFSTFPTVDGYQYDIISEWPAFSERMKNVYSPITDISIGPFNDSDDENIEYIYNEIVRLDKITEFVTMLYSEHQNNLNELKRDTTKIERYSLPEAKDANTNSRCLFAIEIENTSTKKHIMGSVVNAASLGRIGIGVGFCEEAYRAFIRIVNYLNWLKEVGKSSYPVGNFFVLRKSQFEEILDEMERGSEKIENENFKAL